MDNKSRLSSIRNAFYSDGNYKKSDTNWRDVNYEDRDEKTAEYDSLERKYLVDALSYTAINSLEWTDENGDTDYDRYVREIQNKTPEDKVKIKQTLTYADYNNVPLPLSVALTSNGSSKDIMKQYVEERTDKRVEGIKRQAEEEIIERLKDPVFVENETAKDNYETAIRLNIFINKERKYRGVRLNRSPDEKEQIIDDYFYGSSAVLNGCINKLDIMAMECEKELLGEEYTEETARKMHNDLLSKPKKGDTLPQKKLLECFANAYRLGEPDPKLPELIKRDKKNNYL